MPGGGGTTQQTRSEPWGPSQEHLKYIMGETRGLLEGGKGFNPYPESTVIPFSGQSLWGQSGIGGLARQHGGEGSAYQSRLGGIINNGGFNGQQLNAQALWGNQLKGTTANQHRMRQLYQRTQQGTPNDRRMSQIFGDTRQRSASEQNLAKMARGGLLGEGNPYLQGAIDAANRNAQDSGNLGAAMAGRYGSADHAGKVGSDVADITTQAMFGQYNNDVQNMLGANQMMDSARMGRLGMGSNIANQMESNRMNRMGMGANLASQMAGIQSNAASNMFNSGQQGIGNMQSAYQAQQMPYEQMMRIGSLKEDLARRQMQEKVRIWEGEQNAPWQRLQAANAMFGGAGQLGGFSSTTVPGPSPWQSALGNGMMGYGMMGWPGALFGGLSGLFG